MPYGPIQSDRTYAARSTKPLTPGPPTHGHAESNVLSVNPSPPGHRRTVTRNQISYQFLDLAGVKYGARDFDGESLLPILIENGKLKRDAIYFHFPHYAFHCQNRMGGIIRSGDYKLIRYYDNNQVALYNMRKDIGEKNDLTKEMPEMAARLSWKLDAWLKETKAAMPRPVEDIPEEELYGRK